MLRTRGIGLHLRDAEQAARGSKMIGSQNSGTALLRRAARRLGTLVGVFAGALLIGAGTPAVAQEPATIEWYMIDLPPIQIASGALAGRGYTDLIRWRLIAGLPEYRHELRIANVQRILADIRSKPNVCNPAFLRTPEREAYMVFAEALHAQFPNGAVVLRERSAEFAPYVNADGSLAVGRLLDSPAGAIAVQSGRSYGVVLDGLLGEAQQRSRVVTLTSNRPVEAKLGMLTHRRADLALLYPYELAHHLAGNSAEAARYDFLPVEGNGTYTLNHLACSASPLGRTVIERANPIVAAERDYFAAAYRAWVPESILALHQAHHLKAFGRPLAPMPLNVPAIDEAIASCLMRGGTWHRDSCSASR